MAAPTADPDIVLEHAEDDLWRYRRISTGERWTVYGHCDRRGDCLIGAVIEGEEVRTKRRARQLARTYVGPDVPVTPGFSGCCPLKTRRLPRGPH